MQIFNLESNEATESEISEVKSDVISAESEETELTEEDIEVDEMEVNRFLAKEFIESHLQLVATEENIEVMANFIFEFEHQSEQTPISK